MAIWRIFLSCPYTKTLTCFFLADSHLIIYHWVIFKSLIHSHGLSPPIIASSIGSMILLCLMIPNHWHGSRPIRLLLVEIWKNGFCNRMDYWIMLFIRTFSTLSWWVRLMIRQCSTTLLLVLSASITILFMKVINRLNTKRYTHSLLLINSLWSCQWRLITNPLQLG